MTDRLEKFDIIVVGAGLAGAAFALAMAEQPLDIVVIDAQPEREGWPPLDETVDLEAADTILGGYFSSRITRNIREDKGYTYSPNSAVSVEYDAAYWRQNADVTSEATGPALTEIIKEIRGLQACAAYQPAIDVRDGKYLGRIRGFD